MTKEPVLKLIYVLKIGYDSKRQGLYQFIFAKDPSSIDPDAFGWNQMPANGNAQAPSEDYVDAVLEVRTNKIDLKCLHELDDRAYIDGYHAIHCLAFENIDSENSDMIYDETPLLVLHYGLTIDEVKNLFLQRDILLKELDVSKSKVAQPKQEEEDEEEEDEEEIDYR